VVDDRPIPIDRLDLRDHLRSGDVVVWGQAGGEPRTLVEHLLRSPTPPNLRAFIGLPGDFPFSVDDAAKVAFTSYTGAGRNSILHDAGRLEILPAHYSQLPFLIVDGPVGCDVAFVRLSEPDADGRHSLGLTRDHLVDAIARARVVIAEIDSTVPWTYGGPYLNTAQLSATVASRYPAAEAPAALPNAVHDRIAGQVAEWVEDGATLQFGVGALTEAVLSRLGGHRDLGVHSGQIPDGVVELMQSGVITGSRKSVDRFQAVGGMLLGGRTLSDYAHRNKRIVLRGTRYTHAADVLAAQSRFTAMNSAVEVDLTGQVNAEVAAGRYVGSVGGAIDFLRGASASRGGVPIVMLPSTAASRSRIVSILSGPVSTPRSDVGVVITEHGSADLRGLTLSQRVAAMIAIADPAHCPALDQVADRTLATAATPS
jgi:acetyl-CoA hydrolase